MAALVRARRCVAVALAVATGIAPTGCSRARAPREPFADAKIGFVFVGTRDDLGYNQAAWEGSESLARAFPDHEVLRVENVPEDASATAAIESLIRRGARILFATSFGHLGMAAEVARRHPDVIVVHQGGVEPTPRQPNLGTYWGTVYETVYQAGITAGAATRTGKLGYVAAFPIPATFNNINAFTLGARSVNSAATTVVEFTGAWCDPLIQAQAARRLLSAGADVLAQHQDCTRTILGIAETAGVYAVGYHADGSEVAPRAWLVGAVWIWDDLYVHIVRTILDGTFATSRFTGDYRGGLATGDNPFVLTDLGPAVQPATAAAVAAATARFRAGATPFDGPLFDRDGRQRVAPGVQPAREVIEAMDYVVAGVVGEIPNTAGDTTRPSR